MNIGKALVLAGLRPFLPKKWMAELEKPFAQHRYEKIERPRRLAFFGRLIKPGDLCFDVGAHVGDLAALFVELGAHVVAIEPQSQCAAVLRQRFAQAVDVVECALSSQAGEATLYIADENVASTLSQQFQNVLAGSQVSDWFRARRFEQEATVETMTLDQIIERFGLPQFCKIDVEGFEHEVVSGLSQPIKRLSLEFTGEALQPVLQAVDRLETLASYRYNVSHLSNYQLQFDRWCDSVKLRNYLAEIGGSIATGDVYAVDTAELPLLGFIGED